MHTDIENCIDFVIYSYIHVVDHIRMNKARINDAPLSLTQQAVKQLHYG